MQSKFTRIKNEILGKNYSLSIAFVSSRKSQELNNRYRKKDRPTNVLSFALRENEGELVLCKTLIKKEAKATGKTFKNWLGFLVIHGMLHLKGHEHSSTMEKLETKYDQKYFSRNRRRIIDHKSTSGRILQRRKKS